MFNFTTPSVAHRTPIILKADTGTCRHYIRQSNATRFLTNTTTDTKQVKVYLPNNEVLVGNTRGLLPIDLLSPTAKKAHVFPSHRCRWDNCVMTIVLPSLWRKIC